MSRLQAIENALKNINESVFQELCDSFLAIENKNYSAFSRLGSQSGKQKSVKGTPDSLILLPSGKYLFVEHTTNISKGFQKIKVDISKCLDPTKTSIPHHLISEILICLNFNLSTKEIEELRGLISASQIRLTIYTLDSLSTELHLNYRGLVRTYLNLPLDTGQIISIDEFVKEYNEKAKKGLSSFIDNQFLHRKNELEHLLSTITSSDFIVLTGPSGVGKTRIALEAIKSFLTDNLSFQAFCIWDKSHILLDDLYLNLPFERDFILFVDDANRLERLAQIIGFYNSVREGKLKLILTVRDYAFNQVASVSRGLKPIRIDLKKLGIDEIRDIISSEPFRILNGDYQERILEISDGNPRIAIMLSSLAKEKQSIYALYDVSKLFEEYFKEFVDHNSELSNTRYLKILGLISFFFVLPYKDRNQMNPILKDFGIEYSNFIDAIDKLDALELVEIQFDQVKIPEQNLSTYYFYRVFIKEGLLSFQILLRNYFDSNMNRFRECIIPANNRFDPSEVERRLRGDLVSHFNALQSKDELIKFLSVFWFYLKRETIDFVFQQIKNLPDNKIRKYEVDYNANQFAFDKEPYLELLSRFFLYTEMLKEALEVAFEYTRKLPNNVAELIYHIREKLSYRSSDLQLRFFRQQELFALIFKKLRKGDKLYFVVFYELAKTFIKFKFQYFESGIENTFKSISIQLPQNQIILNSRKKILQAIEDYFEDYPKESFKFLESYLSTTIEGDKEIIEDEAQIILSIIENKLDNKLFEHCWYVNEQIRWYEHKSIENERFKLLKGKFTSKEYKVYLILDWDRRRDKNELKWKGDFKDYEEFKQSYIRNSFLFNTENEVLEFYKIFRLLFERGKNAWNYHNSLDLILDENFARKPDLVWKMLDKIIDDNNDLNYVPRDIFSKLLKSEANSNRLWSIINKKSFEQELSWKLRYFAFLDENLVSQIHPNLILETYKSIISSTYVQIESLKKYLSFSPNLFVDILRIIYQKNKDAKYSIMIRNDFIFEQFHLLKQDFAIVKKTYLQQYKLQDSFDYQGKAFVKILEIDKSFLLDFSNSLLKDNELNFSIDSQDLGFIWSVGDIEDGLEKVFDLIIDNTPYIGIREHFCNSFFKSLDEGSKKKGEKFLSDYIEKNNTNSRRVNVVVDICRNSMAYLFDKILIQHISRNPDVEVFRSISWTGSGGIYSGDQIIGDIKAAAWTNIRELVSKADLGFKVLEIKKYINDQIEQYLREADATLRRRFQGRF